MAEVLRDPVWQFVGVLLAIMAIIVSIGIYRAQRQKKRLMVDVLVSLPLLTISEERVKDLRLTYKGQSLEKARLVLLQIKNAGDAPILASDVETPLRIAFPKGSRVLSVEIVETIPSGLAALGLICPSYEAVALIELNAEVCLHYVVAPRIERDKPLEEVHPPHWRVLHKRPVVKRDYFDAGSRRKGNGMGLGHPDGAAKRRLGFKFKNHPGIARTE